MATTVIDTLVTNLFYRTDMPSVKRAQARLTSLRRGLTQMSNAFITQGAVAAGGLALVGKTAYDVDKAMNRLEATGQLTNDQLERAKNLSLEVGSDLPLNTADIIKAMEELLALGLTFEEAMEAVPAAALASIAADENIADVAEWATIIKNTYGVTADELDGVMDKMVKIRQITPATFGDVGRALEHSAQTMSDAGVPLSTYIALLGVAAGSGKRAEAASQGFSLVLGNIAKASTGLGRGSQMVIKAFDHIGIAQEEMIAAMKDGGIVEVFKLIQERAPSQDHLTAFFTQLGGTTYAAPLSHLAQNVGKIDDVIMQLDTSQGVAQRQAETMMQGVSGAWMKLGAMWDTLKIRIAEAGVEEALTNGMNALINFMNWLTETDDATGELVRGNLLRFITAVLTLGPLIIGIGVGIRALAWAVGGFQIVLGAVTAAIGWFRNALLLTRIQLAALAVWQGITTAATWLFSAALWANPITWVVAGILALIAGLAALFIWWDQISAFLWKVFGPTIMWLWNNALKPFIDFMSDIFTPVFQWLFDLLKPIIDLFKWFGKVIKAGLGALGGLVPDWLKNMFKGEEAEVEISPKMQGPPKEFAGEIIFLNQLKDEPVPEIGTEEYDQYMKRKHGAAYTPGMDPELLQTTGTDGALPEMNGGTMPGLTAPLPVAPPEAVQHYQQPQFAAGSAGNTYNIQLDNITVNANTANEREIAQNVTKELRDQLQTSVESVDSNVAK